VVALTATRRQLRCSLTAYKLLEHLAANIRVAALALRMSQNPFDTIESAHEYLRMLGSMLEEVQATTPGEFEVVEGVNADDRARREQALRLVLYKLDQLRHHVAAGSRILNDLRTLRRLLLGERYCVQASPLPES